MDKKQNTSSTKSLSGLLDHSSKAKRKSIGGNAKPRRRTSLLFDNNDEGL